jgi:transcriptional regulator CtsR
MGSLADFIERYLRAALEKEAQVELQRRELAKLFCCVPSQINYVLETRFTLERGFLTESKRGGGGYIRISRVEWQKAPDFPQLLDKLLPAAISAEEAEHILFELTERRLIGSNDARLLGGLIRQNIIDFPERQAGVARSKLLKALLLVLESRIVEREEPR